MEKTDVLIIGGGPAGMNTAVAGKSHYPNKDFLVIRKQKQVLVPCGIPYIFGELGSSDKNILPDAILNNAGVPMKIGEIVSIDKQNKICKMADGTEIGYEKLVYAMGSEPIVPKWLQGAKLENVFSIPKDKEYIDALMPKLANFKKIVVIGGGFIGVEVGDELNKLGKEVTIVEILPTILGAAFDEDIATHAQEAIKARGVKLNTGTGVKQIMGETKVESVLLQNGEQIEADAVILSMGYRPNTDLAANLGTKTNEMGFICVDEYMRTSDPDAYAVGDCAEKKDFFVGKISPIMLASTACAEGRVAGMNLFKLSTVKAFSGTIAIFATGIGDLGLGVAGMTENMARKENFDIIIGTGAAVDKHPGTLPQTHKQMVKLIVARESSVILGGEVVSGPSTGELTNLIGLAVQQRMTVNSILTSQISTHPLLTASPIAYPFIKAAENCAKQLRQA